ncbi:MAG: class I SAM-dependent methyltransferase [Lachnospiraceae bacterium]|nr:class I SAM-dependent methyltransferase [Lachnospiraceae bacterium]
MELSKRLQAVAELVTPGMRLADVGTDHAYIPIYLVQQKRIPSAVAMDVKQGPLERARANIEGYQLGSYIDVRLSDGLQALQPQEADTVVIAGMGGPLVQRIMTRGEKVLEQMQECILQPQSEIAQVRAFLAEQGYCITAENMIEEDGKYYPMMRVCHGKMHFTGNAETKYGPCLLRDRNPVLLAYLKREQQVQEKIKQQVTEHGRQDAEKRLLEIEREMQDITAALAYYEV